MECIVGGKGERLAGTIDLGRDARRLGARVVADSGPLSIWPECLGGGNTAPRAAQSGIVPAREGCLFLTRHMAWDRLLSKD